MHDASSAQKLPRNFSHLSASHFGLGGVVFEFADAENTANKIIKLRRDKISLTFMRIPSSVSLDYKATSCRIL